MISRACGNPVVCLYSQVVLKQMKTVGVLPPNLLQENQILLGLPPSPVEVKGHLKCLLLHYAWPLYMAPVNVYQSGIFQPS